MIKSINQWSLPGTLSMEQALLAAKKAGFAGYEPAFNLEGELSFKSHTADAKKLRALADSEGIELVSLASGLYWEYSFAHNDPAMRAKGHDICKAQLDCAAELGVDTILVVPGKSDESIPYDVAYNRALEGVNSLKDYAAQAGVVIGLENVWNNFLLSPLEYRDFMDQVGSPYVGMYFDVGNVLRVGYPQHWIKILGERIKKVHIKDFNLSVGNINGFVSLLEGNVNFPAVMQAFKEIGYDGAIIAEVFCHPTQQEVFPSHTSLAMDAILAM